MVDQAHAYTRGDWIVHLTHGPGQIERIEEKRLGGKGKSYYRVRTEAGILWIPVENANNGRIRPVAGPAEWSQALEILRRPPRAMDPDHMQRKRWIKEVQAAGSLEAICRLVRDLTARKACRALNFTEERALRHFAGLLGREWSASMKIDEQEAHLRLAAVLNEIPPVAD